MFAIWLCGFGILLGKALANTLRLSRQLKGMLPGQDPEVTRLLSDCREVMGLKTSMDWFETTAVRGPALQGWFRARLLLPVGYARDISREELRLVFLHELAHVKRRDIAANWLVTVLQFVHWFNPVLWFAFGRYRFQSKSKGQWRVTAMNDQGYVQALIAQSGELPPLVLLPYGALEGTLVIGGQVAAGKKIVLQLEGGMWGTDDSLTALTDARGRFRLERVPPGTHTLFRSVPTGYFMRMNSHPTLVQVPLGRSTEVVLQSEGAIVTGFAKMPVALQGLTNVFLSGRLQTLAPKPPGVIQSVEEMEAWNASPELQNYRQSRKDYTFEIAPDGRFVVDGVVPGHYSVFLSAAVRSMKVELSDESVATGVGEVRVPEDAGPGVPLDVGGVEMVSIQNGGL